LSSFFLRFAKQWIAGETIDDGISRAQIANSRGILGLLNLLGEEIEVRNQVDANVAQYIQLLERIAESKTDSQISIKPTQLGLNIDFDYCVHNYATVARYCEEYSNWLWVDMEDSCYTTKTIDLYKKILVDYPFTGIAIQAYLRRSYEDLRALLPLGAKIRLVKGAYNESPHVAFRQKREVSENYSKLLKLLFEAPGENFFAIATHDSELVSIAKEYSKTSRSDFEFEMLMGVRDQLKQDLVESSYQVREYIPYGPNWFAYSIRRLREKKSNILLLLRSLFSA
jgi:proline dehydrogenase